MDYVKFTEHNEWEGEIWNFWIPVEGNDVAIGTLSERLNKNEELEDIYTLNEELVPEMEIDILVKHCGGGYRADQEKLKGVLDLKKISEDDLFEILYKGGIVDLMKKRTKSSE